MKILFENSFTSVLFGQVPLTVTGNVLNDRPLVGFNMTAAWLGGGEEIVASRPTDPLWGFCGGGEVASATEHMLQIRQTSASAAPRRAPYFFSGMVWNVIILLFLCLY